MAKRRAAAAPTAPDKRRTIESAGFAGARSVAEGRRGAEIERVQTGVRMEKRVLLVLKAMAAAHDLSLGDLLEGIVLHAFEGKAPFGPESIAKIDALRGVYRLDLTAADSHLLVEAKRGRRAAPDEA